MALVSAGTQQFVAWLVVVVWTTQVAAISKIAKPLRDWLSGIANGPNRPVGGRGLWVAGSALVRCPLCLGFWVGAVLHFAGLRPILGGGWSSLAEVPLDGAAASLCAFVAHLILVRLGSLEL